MRFDFNIIIFLFCFSIISCSHEEEKEVMVFKKNANILILGNSILKHSASPDLGWYGDWGMAATAPEKDFSHVFSDFVKKSNKYSTVKVYSQNIAYWENDFTYDVSQYADISAKRYDVIIVRLGENVGNTDDYYQELNKMIDHFRSQKTKVIITDVVWYSEIKESIQRQIALDNNYKFISLTDFQNNPDNYS